MKPVPLEDNFEDVLMKAARGLGFGKQFLSDQSGLSSNQIESLLRGQADTEAIRAIASVLQLNAEALIDLANDAWRPPPIEIDGLVCLNTAFPVSGYETMTVNSFLVRSPGTDSAVIFDTGSDADGLFRVMESLGVDLKALFLTHTHRDHVAAYDSILAAKPGLPSYVSALEPYGQATGLSHGTAFSMDHLQIEARLTPGHSPGGLTYLVEGLERPLAFVGDALFCLSQGGVPKSAYQAARQANREQIFSLPDETVLCPGHGPLTTVAWERARNPFY